MFSVQHREFCRFFSRSIQGNLYIFQCSAQSSVNSSLAAYKVICVSSVFRTESSADSSLAAFKVIYLVLSARECCGIVPRSIEDNLD